MLASFSSLTFVKNKSQSVHLWHARSWHPSMSRKLLFSHCNPQIVVNNNEQFSQLKNNNEQFT